MDLDDDGRRLLDQLFDKWSLLVLDVLCDGPRRFNELRRQSPAVSAKSLTACLRRLERNGIIQREVIATAPVAIEYRITALGRTLQNPLQAMLSWIVDHGEDVKRAQLCDDKKR